MAEARKSTLVTPDPHHTPGYSGYIPQFKYQLGRTFGSHTHNLLADSKVPLSSNPVLSDTSAQQPHLCKTKEDFFASPVYHQRTRSLGDQKYIAQMVPGYTGHIPKKMHYFGSRYAETCHYAVTSFEDEQQKHENKRDKLRTLSRDQQNPATRMESTLAQNTTPLKTLSTAPNFYLSPHAQRHYMSPFSMPDNHPHKCFVSGYAGFVPRSQNYLGHSYPIITRQALQNFAGERRRRSASLDTAVQVFREQEMAKRLATVYLKDSGLMPHYTGHIPGGKFKYGSTFGASTAVPELQS